MVVFSESGEEDAFQERGSEVGVVGESDGRRPCCGSPAHGRIVPRRLTLMKSITSVFLMDFVVETILRAVVVRDLRREVKFAIFRSLM